MPEQHRHLANKYEYIVVDETINKKNCPQSFYSCISRCSTTAKIKLFMNYKREIYALAHLNLSTASFKCLKVGHMFHAYNLY